jgi:hypothetical protein
MQSRRGFLAASVTVSAATVAGCSGILGGDGGETNGGGAAGGRYTALVAETDERPVRVNLQRINELAANENFSGIGHDESFLGISPSDVEYDVKVTKAGC